MESITASAARFGGIGLLRMQSDERLAELAAAGHQPAFDVLDRRYRASLLRACRRVLPGDRAEDAVQQALLNAHQALARGGAPDKLRPWLHKIAVNASLRELGEGPDAIEIDEDRVGGTTSAADVLEEREAVRSAFGAIGGLPENQRTALVRREFEGRSHEQIARELGLSGGAVRQLIHRARNGVRSAVSAVVPAPLIVALLSRAETAGVLSDATAVGIGGGLGTKALVTALVAGGIAGGAALAPLDSSEGERENRAESEREAEADDSDPGASDHFRGHRGEGEGAGSGHGGGEGSGHGEDRSGHGDGDGDHGGDGGGDSGPSESSGPGSGGSSGSGSSGSGSSGSSGSGFSGSGSSGSGSSGSGSGSTGTSSGSGSGTSGSGTGGSSGGSSGPSESGSSGSGSGDSGGD